MKCGVFPCCACIFLMSWWNERSWNDWRGFTCVCLFTEDEKSYQAFFVFQSLTLKVWQNADVFTHWNDPRRRIGTCRCKMNAASFLVHLQTKRCLHTPSRYAYQFWYYRKRGSASYIVREWLLWVVERERDACDVIDITLKSRVIMHMITSTARWPYAYAYASTRSEPAAAIECSKCMTSQNHKQQLLRPRSGPSKIQKHIPEQPGWMNSKYWGNIEKRNQINTKNYWK